MNERKQSAEHRGEQQQRRESERDSSTGTLARLTHGRVALAHTLGFEIGRKFAHVLLQTARRNRAASAVELPRVQNAAHVDALEANCSIGDAQRCFKCIRAWFNLKTVKTENILEQCFFFFFFFFSCHEKRKKQRRKILFFFFFFFLLISYSIACSLNSSIDSHTKRSVVRCRAKLVIAHAAIFNTLRLKDLVVALARALRRPRRCEQHAHQRQNENN
jgi:hypothetical protein